jgi:nicotinamidase-related amidase
MNLPATSRREALIGAAAVAATSVLAAQKTASAAAGLGGINAIPPLAAMERARPGGNTFKTRRPHVGEPEQSLYDAGGAQAAERHREGGSLPATVNVERRAGLEFQIVQLIGYEVFRENYLVGFRTAHSKLTKGLNFTPDMKKQDNELVGELRALVRPGDNEFNELRCRSFAGTMLPLELARKRVQTIVLTGIHLTGASRSRAARDAGYLPIVIGDACACQKPEQEAAAMERINNFFAPVISSDRFVELLSKRS